MGSLATSLFSLMLGWVQGTVYTLWNAVINPGQGSFLGWLGDHWISLTLILCAAGLILDLCVYLFRWRPYKVWASFFRRRKNRQNQKQPEDVAQTDQASGIFFPVRSEAEEEEVPEEPDSWVPEAPVLSRREQMEQSLLTGRRRFRVTNLLSEREDEYETRTPQEVFNQQDSYGQPVYPRKWGTDEDQPS